MQCEIAHLGENLTCIGTIQPDGREEYQACIDAGVNVEVGYFPVKKIRDYYRRSKKIIIPAVHGSERTVLEAMSCNVFPQVTNPNVNVKTATYMEEYMEAKKEDKDLTLRQFVLDNYSHKIYAKQILKGLE